MKIILRERVECSLTVCLFAIAEFRHLFFYDVCFSRPGFDCRGCASWMLAFGLRF